MGTGNVVLVVGTGTIGEPLIGMLTSFKDSLGIDEIAFHKRTPLLTDRSKVLVLCQKGAKLCVDADRWSRFVELGMRPDYETEEALERATVVVDCTPVGNENKEKLYNRYVGNTQGFIAQGSEFGFGKMYARGINDAALQADKDQFLHVVSCNTHNLAVLIDTIALGPEKEDFLEEGRFVCMRRASDISEEEGFLPAPEVGKHDDRRFGTHHARDAFHLFQTLGLELDLFSSTIKLNTQYMHCISFNVRLKKKITMEELMKRLRSNPRIALTQKRSAGPIFSFGRDHGLFGRILNQTVIPVESLAIRKEREVAGFCFTPQDGNSLLGSISAVEWFLHPENYERKIHCLRPYFFSEI
jgi:glyceraldehyde-3-phosphate dehydrogenase (NAD(P))